uniref:Uncharacterized protein n=1 Tax=Utricularia reniformis TaxID=192314 RepID=A0A1Y0B2R1_9LAMI|nr:hypothetical protein AEK19_MT1539 [Utricularia reniformis]ART31726.1 hypothetical protein AEK19_MT1539 [Utricularia reniformis]
MGHLSDPDNDADSGMFQYGIWSHLQKTVLVGVDQSNIESVAALIGCKGQSLPFLYLGLPVGAPMYSIKSWEPIISKTEKRLSAWENRFLSLGGPMVVCLREVYRYTISPSWTAPQKVGWKKSGAPSFGKAAKPNRKR